MSATCLATVTHVPSAAGRDPGRAGALAAVSVVSLMAATPLPAGAAVIYTINNNSNYTQVTASTGTLVIGDKVTSGVGYTLIDNGFVSTTLRTTNKSASTISVFGASTVSWLTLNSAGTSGSPVSIISGGTDNWNVRAVGNIGTTTRGAASGTVVYSGYGAGGYTSGSPDKTTITVNTTFVAPVAKTSGDTTVYALPGQTGSTSYTVSNAGDGNKAGTGTAFNLAMTGNARSVSAPWTSGALPNTATGTASLTDDSNGVKTSSSVSTLFTYKGESTRGSSSAVTLTSKFQNGNPDGKNTSAQIITTLTGVTVAPVASTTTTGTGGTTYVLAGSGATVTGKLTVANTGDGTLAGANLQGTLANTLGTGFSASTAAGAISLGDAKNPGPGTSLTQTLTYTAEASRGALRSASSVATFSNGSADGTNAAAASVAVSLSAQSVAPVASTSTAPTSLGPVRVGTSATTTHTVKNIGDGNLAGKDDGVSLLSNLRGNVSVGGSPAFSGGGAVNLTDSASQTYMFTYAPTARGTDAGTIATALTNGAADGTNKASTVNTAISGTAVGPDYDAAVAGKNASSGPITNGGTILFGEPVGGLTLQDLLISNLSNDAASKSLTDLTLTNVTITGSTEFSFSLSGFDSGNTPGFGTSASNATLSNLANGDGQGAISIQFVNKAGSGAAQLRIETDEGAALGGAGAVYVYNLVWAVPEPGTIAVFGAGLLGLAISRQRRRGRAFVALTSKPDEEETPQSAR